MTDFGGAIVDVDGTLVRGTDVLSGAPAGLASLHDAGIETLLFSNNPTKSPEYYRDRLRECGLSIDDVEVLTAAVVTAEYLASEHPDATIFVVGEQGLREQLRAHDLTVDSDPEAADVVVASIDREFDYELLSEARRALDAANAFVGTDPDRTIPTEEGSIPGSGAIVGALKAVSDRNPDLVIGKPSPIAAGAAFDRLGVPPEECLVVGDRLDTDVALGERAGTTTALVLTGSTSRAQVDSADVTPDYVLDSLGDLDELLDQGTTSLP